MAWYQRLKTSAQKKQVWLSGQLKQTRDGFVYLDVPDSIIRAFQQMIPDEEIAHPSGMSKKYVGAHISVMMKDESDGKNIKEIGQHFQYKIKALQAVKPDGWDGVRTVFFIAVDAPELEDLRKKYGLSAKHKGHDFHITVGLVKS
jgi:hypothetical protein